MKKNISSFIKTAGTAALAAGSIGFAYSNRFKRELKLQILTPEADIFDTKTEGFDYPPSIANVPGFRHVFSGSELSFAYTMNFRF